ncbi:MAG: FecR family protein [Acidobacteria bacterium]|nr:FecR family protein [Acidobacteriota bacterium]
MARDDGESTFDWFLISIDKLRLIGGILLLLLVAGTVWLFRDEILGSTPRQRAQAAIEAAEHSLNEMAALPNLQEFRSQYDSAESTLGRASDAFEGTDYPAAETLAREAEATARSVLSRLEGEARAAAQFLTVEGRVEFQRGGSGDWLRATARSALQRGDWVRTAENSSAEIFFGDGTLYTIGPRGLLEIYPRRPGQPASRSGSVSMEIGSIEVNTGDDASTVSTPATAVTVNTTSTTLIDVRTGGGTEIAAVRGTSSVASSGGPTVSLEQGQRIEADPSGRLSEVRGYTSPPALTAPADNAIISASKGRIIELQWRPVPGAAGGYRLQVSRSRLFGNIEIDAGRDRPSARVRLTSSGSFFWRVASIDRNGQQGPFSGHRRFRVTGISEGPGVSVTQDTTPPSLQLDRPSHLGGPNFIIRGVAEPGASIFIDEEQVPVGSDGSFSKLITFRKIGYNTVVVKAVDPAGNQTVMRERVLVEE